MNFRQAVLTDLINNLRGAKFRKKPGRPYMRSRELIIFEELVMNLQPKKILEWGAGYSTHYFPRILKGKFEWLSVESDGEWFSHLQELNQNPNVKIELVPGNIVGNFGFENDGSYEEFQDYIEYPTHLAPFDYIVIDGRARSECLKKAFDLLSDKGVVVVHDVNREYYHEYFDLYEYKFVILDNRKRAGGVAMLSKGSDISSLVTTDAHEKSWNYVRNKVAKFLMV